MQPKCRNKVKTKLSVHVSSLAYKQVKGATVPLKILLRHLGTKVKIKFNLFMSKL
jgi:hypothetical protein